MEGTGNCNFMPNSYFLSIIATMKPGVIERLVGEVGTTKEEVSPAFQEILE